MSESRISILEHRSEKYSPRTYHNAESADLTIALAVDYETAGERLTKKAAGDRYLVLPLTGKTRDPMVAARLLYQTLRERNLKNPVINVAGNGIYTLKEHGEHGFDQDVINLHLSLLLGKVSMHWPIRKIISGGQTGVDMAGIVAASVMGVDAEATLPRGFLQRGLDKQDRKHTEEEIRHQVTEGRARVQTMIRALSQADKASPQADKASPQTDEPQPGSIRVVSKRQGGIRPELGETVIDGDRKHPVFGNRHYLSNWQDPVERAAVIERHRREDFEPDIERGGPIYREMQALADRVRAGERIALSCWCAPLPCHCDHIAAGILKLSQGVDLKQEIHAKRQGSFEKGSDDGVSESAYRYTFFYGHKDPFSNWYPARFSIDDKVFKCNEQFLMFKKARLFGDEDTARKILAARSPKECKALGRAVRGFEESVWEANRYAIMKEGLTAKFSQNPKLQKDLLDTGGTELVEASPYDRIWGVGRSMDDPDIKDPRKWRGRNLMGRALTEVRDALRLSLKSQSVHTANEKRPTGRFRNAGFPILVFGSNLAGRHGKGAAKDAMQHYGAEYGVGVGPSGHSYAIPTKDERVRTLPLEDIARHVRDFLEYAGAHPKQTFLVTPIGTGLAGYTHEEIAPLFEGAPENCLLPGVWKLDTQRLIIAGSRSLAAASDQIFEVMDTRLADLRKTLGDNANIEVVSGGAPGVDRIGEAWAKARGLDCIRFPADWDRLSRRAGMIRNRSLACYGNALELFWDGVSPGSRDMAALCQQEGIPTRVHELATQTPDAHRGINEAASENESASRRCKP